MDRYCPNSDAFCEDIESIIMTADPYIDILTLQEMLRDYLAFSLTAKGLNIGKTSVNSNTLAKMR